MRSSFHSTVHLALVLLVAVLTLTKPMHAEGAETGPRVVASIAPVHSLVSAIMAGVGEPHLLLPGTVSPHSYRLKPTDASLLEKSQVVFWIGPALESVLTKPMDVIAAKSISVQLMDARAMMLLPRREGGVFNHEEEHDHDEGDADPHVWLNPVNAIVMLFVISETLSEVDPVNAGIYRSNAISAITRMKQLDLRIEQKLESVRSLPYVAFHDAYQYFEERYGLAPLAVVSVDPEHAPGARRVGDIRDAIKQSGAICIFTEPQFNPGLITSLIEGTGARQGRLDPLGAGLGVGPFFYEELLEAMADDLVSCLTQ